MQKKDVKTVTYLGRTWALKDLAQRFEVGVSTLHSRLNRGWSVERAIETPVGLSRAKTVFYRGEERTLKSLSDEFGIKLTTLHNRLFKYGWTIEEAISKPVAPVRKHGMANRHSSEYNAWSDMKYRCYNTKGKYYHRYGGRGITVCDRWRNSFANFYEDMGSKPGHKYSLDRIDNDGNYTPENCRWATREEQGNNKSDNRLITYQGRTQSITQWQRELGFGRGVIERRLHRGLSIERALSTPVAPSEKLITHDGKTQNLTQWAEESVVSIDCLSGRLKRGWDMTKALNTPSAKEKIKFEGEEYSQQELVDKFGINKETFRNRLKRGWAIKKALTTPMWRGGK